MATKRRIDESLFNLPFDQYSRQYIAHLIVEKLRPKKGRLQILDIGGNNGKTRLFFPNDDVLVVDLYDINEPWYVKASALELPFEDNKFDAVVSFDVLEHIAAKDRATFIREATRVSKDLVIIAAPFNTPHVAESETSLNEYFRLLSGKDHQWLREHIDNGLPEIGALEQVVAELGWHATRLPSNNLHFWHILQSIMFFEATTATTSSVGAANKLYNKHLLDIGDQEEPCYRQVYVITPHPLPFSLKDYIKERGVSKPAQLKLIDTAFRAIHEAHANSLSKMQSDLTWTQQALAEHQAELEAIKATLGWRTLEKARKVYRKIRQL